MLMWLDDPSSRWHNLLVDIEGDDWKPVCLAPDVLGDVDIDVSKLKPVPSIGQEMLVEERHHRVPYVDNMDNWTGDMDAYVGHTRMVMGISEWYGQCTVVLGDDEDHAFSFFCSSLVPSGEPVKVCYECLGTTENLTEIKAGAVVIYLCKACYVKFLEEYSIPMENYIMNLSAKRLNLLPHVKPGDKVVVFVNGRIGDDELTVVRITDEGLIILSDHRTYMPQHVVQSKGE